MNDASKKQAASGTTHDIHDTKAVAFCVVQTTVSKKGHRQKLRHRIASLIARTSHHTLCTG